MRLSPLGACVSPGVRSWQNPAAWSAVKEMLLHVAAPVAVRECLVREDPSSMWVGGHETCGYKILNAVWL